MKRGIALLLICSILTLFCGCNDNTTNQVITFEGDTIPQTVDPLLAQSQSEVLVMQHLYDPLFRMDEKGTVQPASAQGYVFSSDGLTCTVTLRDDLVWSDKQPVKAADYVFSLQRAADPVTKAACASELTCIQGAQAVLSGAKTASSLGVRAVDDRTLEIRLTVASNSILAVLAGSAGIPCRQDFFEACGGRYGMDKESTITNGMFAIQGWSGEEPDVYIRLTRFDDYYNQSQVAPAGLYFTIGDSVQRMTRLQESKIDCGEISGEQAATYEQEGFQTLSYADTNYALIFNTKNDHVFANRNLRKAMAGSIDLSGVSSYLPAYCRGADSVVLPETYYGTVPYTSTGYQHATLQSSAKADFAKELATVGADALQSLTLWYVEQEGLRSALDHVVQCWQKDYGLYVTLTPVSLYEMKNGVKEGSFDMAVYPVSTVGNSSLSVLSQFSFVGEEPLNGLTDKTYDALLAQAEKDAVGIGKQQACEQYLLNNAIAVPLYTTRVYYVFGQDCTGMVLDGYHHGLRLENMKKSG